MNRRGFTLVEVLMASLIVAIAVVGVMGALGTLSATDVTARRADLLQRLAVGKLNEIVLSGSTSTYGGSGTFSAEGSPDASWTLDVETTNTTNVEALTLHAAAGNLTQSARCLMYVRPATGMTTQ